MGDKIQDFTQGLGFVVSFLAASYMINLIFGEKVLAAFLWLVLAGMVLFNREKILAFTGRFV